MSKTYRIVGGIAVFVIGSVALAILREMRVGGIVSGVAMFLLLIAFSRVTGLRFGKKTTTDNNLSESSIALHVTKPSASATKVCPKCGKGYDQSWGMCLDCDIRLVCAPPNNPIS
jgi:hypothetical protein